MTQGDVLVVVYEWHGLIAERAPEIYFSIEDPWLWHNISEFTEQTINNEEELKAWQEEQREGEFDEYVYLFEVPLYPVTAVTEFFPEELSVDLPEKQRIIKKKGGRT